MSSFTTPLVVSPLDDGKKWKLVEPFEYHVGSEESDEVIRVPAGFETDYASIPRIFWAIIPSWGKYGKAAVIHDFCYDSKMYSRKKADEIFLEGMEVLGVRKWIRKAMFLAVRAFGWWVWIRQTKTKVEEFKRKFMGIEKEYSLFRENAPQVLHGLKEYAEIISKITSYSDQVIKWLQEKEPFKEHFAVAFLFYRHAIELLDATSKLLKKSSIDPAKILLRSTFETLWQLEYLLNEDCENRGKAFLVCYAHNELIECKKLDTKTNLGQEMRATLKKDKLLRNAKILQIPNIEARITNSEKFLNKYNSVEKEYQKTKEKLKRAPKWYQLFNGPKSIIDLAKQIEQPGTYDQFYRNFSGKVHGYDIINRILSEDMKGNMGVEKICDPADSIIVFPGAVGLGISLHSEIIKKFMPEKNETFKEWENKIGPQVIALLDKCKKTSSLEKVLEE